MPRVDICCKIYLFHQQSSYAILHAGFGIAWQENINKKFWSDAEENFMLLALAGF